MKKKPYGRSTGRPLSRLPLHGSAASIQSLWDKLVSCRNEKIAAAASGMELQMPGG
jgi:hypothetical protein